MNDPTKVSILNEILKEFNLNETDLNEVSSKYDETISLKLGGNIPKVKGSYTLKKENSVIEITDSDDLEIFKKLFPVTPSKAGRGVEEEGTKGSGNGELSIYWLFAHQSGHTAEDTRGGGNPDLLIDGVGVEIKSLESKKISIGRIGSYTDSLNDLNVVLGIDALIIEFQPKGKRQTPPNAFNATVEDLIQACTNALEVYKNDELREIGKIFNIDFISSLYNRLDKLIKKYNPESPQEFTSNLLKGFILQKFTQKPGIPGYVINVSREGILDYTYIDQDKINKLDKEIILDNAELKQGTLVFKSDLFT
jgi:hypothetical protein